MYTVLRLAGVALVALLAGMSVPATSSDAMEEPLGAYDWRMLGHDGGGWTIRDLGTRADEISGTLTVTQSVTGYDALMTSSTIKPPRPFLVTVADNRVIVYADTELGELRFDLPQVDSIPAEWTLRSEEFGESKGKLIVRRR